MSKSLSISNARDLFFAEYIKLNSSIHYHDTLLEHNMLIDEICFSAMLYLGYHKGDVTLDALNEALSYGYSEWEK